MDLKLLLKRGALLAAANWPVVAIQFASRTTFQVLLAVPIVGAAVLVTSAIGADVANMLQGNIRDMFAAITSALTADPVGLAVFVGTLGLVLLGGSMLMFLVKGGTVSVLVTANAAAGAIEREPLTADRLWGASSFTVAGFAAGCTRLFKRYAALGLVLMVVYALSATGYVTLVLVGYLAAGQGAGLVGWTFLAALAAGAFVVWITMVNLVYLLVQVAVATDDSGLADAGRAVVGFVRSAFPELGGIFLVVLAAVVAATFASALALSGVGLIAFVPLVGLVVFPLQLVALLLRGLVFEYIGLTALGAYVTLYRRYTTETVAAEARRRMRNEESAVGAIASGSMRE